MHLHWTVRITLNWRMCAKCLLGIPRSWWESPGLLELLSDFSYILHQSIWQHLSCIMYISLVYYCVITVLIYIFATNRTGVKEEYIAINMPRWYILFIFIRCDMLKYYRKCSHWSKNSPTKMYTVWATWLWLMATFCQPGKIHFPIQKRIYIIKKTHVVWGKQGSIEQVC